MAASSAAAIAPAVDIGIVGAGAMGGGIAQVAALAGHRVRLFDTRPAAAQAAIQKITSTLQTLVAKGRLTHDQASAATAALRASSSLDELAPCGLILEAIIEDLSAKRALFHDLEHIVTRDAILATNTSSLSVTTIAAGLRTPQRVAGMHFFNPAPLMALVEIVSGLATSPTALNTLRATAAQWGKTPVLTRSTPGFIVNRVARSFYGEALRLLNEGAADCATIDAIMRETGGFRMGPFELMDLIGHDVNYAVTESVFHAFFDDPRFTPSLLQQELVAAGYLGRKSGRGFYLYGHDAAPPAPSTYPQQTAPTHIRLFGEDPLVLALSRRLASSGMQIDHAPAAPDTRLAESESFSLYRTDGRTATERAADLANPNIVLLDLAFNYGTAQRLALATADQASPAALDAAAALLQAAGFAVSYIDDAPGMILMRTVATLANEAADAVHQRVCTVEDCDLAMRLGVNYPRGPLEWADELGPAHIVTVLDHLHAFYGDARYRVSPLLRRKAIAGAPFHPAIPQQQTQSFPGITA